jgi:hypothetical protein
LDRKADDGGDLERGQRPFWASVFDPPWRWRDLL